MKHIPQRMCIACRERHEKYELMRVVKTDDGIAIDKEQNMLKRGAYICKSEECVNLAKKKKALSRHFKQNIEDSVYEKLLAEVLNG